MSRYNDNDLEAGFFILGVMVTVLICVLLLAGTFSMRRESHVRAFLNEVAPSQNAQSLYVCLIEGETLGTSCSIMVNGDVVSEKDEDE